MEQYQPKIKEDMQEAIKDIFGPMFESVLQGKMDAHLGYGSNDHGYKETVNRRNGYTHTSITYRVIDAATEWQNRSLKKFYTFLLVDCLYVSVRKDTGTRNCGMYVVLGYDVFPK